MKIKKAFGPIDAFESFAINSTYHGDEMSLVSGLDQSQRFDDNLRRL